jgi:hypothetical protein
MSKLYIIGGGKKGIILSGCITVLSLSKDRLHCKFTPGLIQCTLQELAPHLMRGSCRWWKRNITKAHSVAGFIIRLPAPATIPYTFPYKKI